MKSLVVAGAPAANNGGSITLCNCTVRGTTENNRVGSKIAMKSIHCRGFGAVTPATGVDQIHRVMLVFDRATEGTTPSVTDILNSINVYSFPVGENAWRFQILWDRTIDLSATAESGSIASFKVDLNGNWPVLFNASSAGTVADLASGALWFVVIGTSAAGATAGSSNFNTLVEFVDY